MSGGNRGSLDELDASEIAVVSAVATTTSSLSLIGSTFILLCYFSFKHLRKPSFTLVAILSVTDIFNQLFDLIHPSADELTAMNNDPTYISPVCYVQAIGDNFFELASVLWTTAIAATLYMTVMWRWKLQDHYTTYLKFAAFCYGLPLILTIAPAIDHAFGPAGGACWIIESKSYWRFISFYAPLWLVIIFNAVVYVRVLRLLHRTVRTAGETDAIATSIRTMMKRLSVYPFILLGVWIVPSIQEIVEKATGHQYMALSVIAFGTAGMQGMLNALAYGFSTGVRDAIRDVLARYCKCVRDSQAVASQALIQPGGAAHPGSHKAIGPGDIEMVRGAASASLYNDEDEDFPPVPEHGYVASLSPAAAHNTHNNAVRNSAAGRGGGLSPSVPTVIMGQTSTRATLSGPT